MDKVSVSIKMAIESTINDNTANIFSFRVKDPENFGVLEYDDWSSLTNIVEKPIKTNSNYAVIGLYIYPNDIVSIAKRLNQVIGEIEIASINRYYLKHRRISVNQLGRGITWLDTGTPESSSSFQLY